MSHEDRTKLEKQFEQAMYDDVYMAVWRECGYRAERFRQMIVPPKRGRTGKLYRGGVATAKELLTKDTAGLGILDKKKRLEHGIPSSELNTRQRCDIVEELSYQRAYEVVGRRAGLQPHEPPELREPERRYRRQWRRDHHRHGGPANQSLRPPVTDYGHRLAF